MIIDKIPAPAGSGSIIKPERVNPEISVNKTSVPGFSAVNKTDIVEIGRKKPNFSEELSQKINELKADVKKQASIDRKTDIAELVKADRYVVDAGALAAKLKTDAFDKKI